MSKYYINSDLCINCCSCMSVCGVEAISPKGENNVIDRDLCDGCGICRDVCPAEAIVGR